jgi:hypothetical protein
MSNHVEQPAPLSREIPATIHTEAVKGLFVLNGGASASMLALMGAIWDKSDGKALVPYIVDALVVFAIGLATAAWVNFIRVSASVEWERVFLENGSSARAIALTRRFRRLSAGSLLCFLIGVGFVAAGAIRTLH